MKKNIIIFFLDLICLFLMFFLFYKTIYLDNKAKNIAQNSYINFYEQNANSNYSVSKIIAYSSAYGDNQTRNLSNGKWQLKIYQYTDFAIYLSSKTDENYIKKIWVDNFKINKPPVLGNVNFFYEDLLKFGTNEISENYPLLNSEIQYTVLNDENLENEIQYNTPVFFADCSTPISFKYVNTVSSNYNIDTSTHIIQNGTLLNNLINDTTAINCDFSFLIHLIDKNNTEYINKLYLTIPLANNSSNILSNGSITEKLENLNSKFIITEEQ